MPSIYDRMMTSLNGALVAGDKEFAVTVVNLRNMTKRGDDGHARTAVPTSRTYVANETGMAESTATEAINSVERLGLFDNLTDLPRGQYVIARMEREWISPTTRVHGLPLSKSTVEQGDPLVRIDGDPGEGLSESTPGEDPPCQNQTQGHDYLVMKPGRDGSKGIPPYDMTVGAFGGSTSQAVKALQDWLFTIMPPTTRDENGDVRPSPLSPRLLRVYAYVLDSHRPVFPSDLKRDLGISLAKARRMLDELGPGKPQRGTVGLSLIQRPEDGQGWVPGPLYPLDLIQLETPQGEPVLVALTVSESAVTVSLDEDPEDWPDPNEEYAHLLAPESPQVGDRGAPTSVALQDARVSSYRADEEDGQDDEHDEEPGDAPLLDPATGKPFRDQDGNEIRSLVDLL